MPRGKEKPQGIVLPVPCLAPLFHLGFSLKRFLARKASGLTGFSSGGCRVKKKRRQADRYSGNRGGRGCGWVVRWEGANETNQFEKATRVGCSLECNPQGWTRRRNYPRV